MPRKPDTTQSLEDLAQRLAPLSDVDAMFETFSAFCGGLGFERYSYAQMFVSDDGVIGGVAGKTNLSDAYIGEFISNGFYEADYLASRVVAGDPVIDWTQAFAAFERGEVDAKWRPALAYAWENNVRQGRTIQMVHERQRSGSFVSGISLISSDGVPDREFESVLAEQSQTIAAACDVLAAFVQRGAVSDDHYALTAREHEVLRQLADGLHVQQIADKLGIADRTAAHHLASMRKKLRAKTAAQAVAIGIRQELL